MSHSPCKQMQILTSFKGLALCTSYFDLLVLQNVRTDYMIRMPARNPEEPHFFSCFAHVACVTTDICFLPFVYQVFAWKTQTGALSPPHLHLFLPTWNTSIFWTFWERGKWLLTVCTVNRIVHKIDKNKAIRDHLLCIHHWFQVAESLPTVVMVLTDWAEF